MSVTLKLATSLDGRIATATGESRWITGERARAAVHALRAEHHAVVVGIETALADDPELTVRIKGHAGAQPARVVLDSRQRLPAEGRLVRTAGDIPTYVVSTEPPSALLIEAGVRVLQVRAVGAKALSLDGRGLGEGVDELPQDKVREAPAPSSQIHRPPLNTPIPDHSPIEGEGGAPDRHATIEGEGGRPDLHAVIQALAAHGLTSLFVEGGGQVAASFLRCGLVDRIEWFRAPIILGGEGRPCVGAMALQALADAPRFRRTSVEVLGDDLWERYEKA